MSLTPWRKYGKMSLNKKKSVAQLVRSCRDNWPNIDRDLLRHMIRRENNIVNPSELRKLDRYLKKEFKSRVDHKEPPREKPSIEAKPFRFGFFEWLDKRAERSERKRLEELAQARAEIDFAARNFPFFQPLKEFSDISREKRKEAGLE